MSSTHDHPTADLGGTPKPDLSAGALGRAPDAAPIDERIGHYRILQQVGEGGFGVVYLAEQTEPVRRRVAIKIIKLGMDTRQVVARFEQERQALAMMDHPNIARVLDAGATPTGRPYFVMEYVPGEPITAYCDRHRLSTRQRLELFLPVCDAVQHAHNKGLIHRDLKPSNVLVTVRDDQQPEPKVIDFGVAKAISHRLTEQTIFTEQGQIIGTPEYMSPEQAEMGALDIDTRSDVYSLGVVLYELLTGLLPFDGKELRSAGYAEIQRIIREVEPPRPSTKLTSAGQRAIHIADLRQARVEALARDLRRELEWIPLMAMRKDRTQRYRSVADLADDIRNYLDGLPLIAGPESATYRVKKFVKRHRGPVAVSATVVLALVAATVISARFAWKESQARKAEAKALADESRARQAEATARAEESQARQAETAARIKESQQREIAQTVNKFLITDMLSSVDPERDGPDVRVLTILDRAAAALDDGALPQPAVEASLRRTLGEAYLRIGKPESARPQLERARALVAYLETNDPDAATRLDMAIAETLWRQNRAAEASAILEPITAKLTAGKGPDDPLTLEAMNQLGGTFKSEGRLDDAQRVYADTAERRNRILGPANLDTLITRYNIVLVKSMRGQALARSHDAAGATALFSEALTEMQAVHRDTAAALTPAHWQAIAAQNEVAKTLIRLKRNDEAREAFATLLPLMRETFGPENWRTLEAIANYGYLSQQQQRFNDAASAYEEALRGYRSVRGPAFADTVVIAGWLAQTYESLNRFDDERELLLRTYADLAAAGAGDDRLQPQAALIRDFHERRGDNAAAAEWAAKAAPPPATQP